LVELRDAAGFVARESEQSWVELLAFYFFARPLAASADQQSH
jgi:hypothetical protein